MSANKNTNWFGILLIAIGAIFLLENFNVFQFDLTDFIFQWQVILIIIGLVFFFRSEDRSTGVILILIGGFFLTTDYLDVSSWRLIREFWPVLLIIMGLYIIFKRNGRSGDQDKRVHLEDNDKSSYQETTLDYINISDTLTSSKTRIVSENFRGGKISDFMAGSVVDLRSCSLAPGENVLEVSIIMGGLELLVPPEWKVISHLSPVFGGFDDNRAKAPEKQQDRTLVIKGTIVFGGCELRS